MRRKVFWLGTIDPEGQTLITVGAARGKNNPVIKLLLSHQWKSFWRKNNSGKNLAIQIFIGFITLYVLASSIALGFFLDELLKKLYPGQNSTTVFCGFLLYYFLFDILIRFLMQDLPTLSIQPYLVQNIRRSQLIGFLNVRSLFVVYNFIPLLLFMPFVIMSIGRAHGAFTALAFGTSLLALTIFNHFLVLYVKRKSNINSWWMVLFFVVISVCIGADYYKIFSVSKLSSLLFTGVLAHPWLVLLLLVLPVAAFINNYYFLLQNLYLEDIVSRGKRKEGADYLFLNRFGAIGEMIGLDIKLILRNKRPRAVVMMSFIFLFYGFIFYKQQYIDKNMWGFLLFGGIFITGLFISSYGQFLFAWQSGHFDGMMAGHISIRNYIKSKFVLFTAAATAVFLLSLLYGFWSWKLLVVQVAGYLYNVGVHTVIVTYLATRTYAGIDISKGATFNYQGMSMEKFLFSIIVFALPMIVYWPFALLITPVAGIIAIAVFGLASFLLQDWWISFLTKAFMKRKYEILDGFRKK